MARKNKQTSTTERVVRTFRDLRVGDTVFVVWQMGRGETERSRTERVSKVGRRYAYFGEVSVLQPFCRDTGVSIHDEDSNARANRQGFDVYLCEADYRKRQADERQYLRLQERLIGKCGRLIELSPDVVDKVNAVLDAAEGHVDADEKAFQTTLFKLLDSNAEAVIDGYEIDGMTSSEINGELVRRCACGCMDYVWLFYDQDVTVRYGTCVAACTMPIRGDDIDEDMVGEASLEFFMRKTIEEADLA